MGESVSQNIRADGTLDRRSQSRLAEAYGALATGDQDNRRGGAVLEFVYLRLNLCGEVFLNVDDGVIVIVAGEALKDFARIRAVRRGVSLKAESLEAHDGVSAADDSYFIHTDHAAFPG